MISQDRHEIYIIVAEYGPGYEEYICPPNALARSSTESETSFSRPGTPTTGACAQVDSLSASTHSSAIPGDPRLLAGSPSYIERVERKSIKVADGPRSGDAQQTQATPETRKSSLTEDTWVPDAGDFLIMHEFGPFIITDSDHMKVLIKRLIAFMLELRGPQSRFIPDRPGPNFLVQPGQDGPSTPSGSTPHPARILRKSRSWPGITERSVEDWEVHSAKPEWQG